MAKFIGKLIVEFVSDNRWIVVKPFGFELNDGRRIIVPEGFYTDFASTPRPFWGLLSPTGDYGKAAVIHDYLYKNGGKIDGISDRFTREQADNIFLEGMIEEGVNFFTRSLVFIAVRLFAGFAWKKN